MMTHNHTVRGNPMSPKKTKGKSFKVNRPVRKPNKDLLKVGALLSNDDLVKRCSFNKEEKKAFASIKSGRGKWKIEIAGVNENNGWQRYLATKNNYLFSWKEGILSDRYVVIHSCRLKLVKAPKSTPKESRVGKTEKQIAAILKKEMKILNATKKKTSKKKSTATKKKPSKKKTKKVKKD